MLKIAAAAFAFTLSTGFACAQQNTSARIAHEPKGCPGTVGAMAGVTYGVATSAYDVALQQKGMTTMAQGAVLAATTNAAGVVSRASPGTVGAAPGSTQTP